jgi:hypothetical protein
MTGEVRRYARKVSSRLCAALEAEIATTVTGPCEDQEVVKAA